MHLKMGNEKKLRQAKLLASHLEVRQPHHEGENVVVRPSAVGSVALQQMCVHANGPIGRKWPQTFNETGNIYG